MNIRSLELKNRLTIEKTGEQYFDLSAPSFTYKRELGVKALHYVTTDQAGRIDKISQQYFGTGAYVDAICIVNKIFKGGKILLGANLQTRTNTNTES